MASNAFGNFAVSDFERAFSLSYAKLCTNLQINHATLVPFVCVDIYEVRIPRERGTKKLVKQEEKSDLVYWCTMNCEHSIKLYIDNIPPYIGGSNYSVDSKIYKASS